MASTSDSPLPPPPPPDHAAKRDSRTSVVEYEKYIEAQLRKTRSQVRSVDIAGNLMLLLAATLAYLLLAAIFDHWLIRGGLGVWGRLVFLLVYVFAAVYFVATQVLPLCVRKINPIYAAHTIERSRPTLKNALVNFLLFRADRGALNPVVYDAIEEQAATNLAKVPVDSAVDRTKLIRIGYALVGLFLLAAIYTLLSPKDLLQTAERLAMPWADIAPPTSTTISEVSPLDTRAFRGQQVTVECRVQGLPSDGKVNLFYTTADGQIVDRALEMAVPPGDYKHRVVLPSGSSSLEQSLSYRIAAGDATTRTYHVEVSAAPTIVVESVGYKYPAYTALQATRVEHQGDLKAIEGTEVTIEALANSDIESATVDFQCDGAHELRMQADGPKAKATFRLQLKDDRQAPEFDSYQLVFKNELGQRNPQPIRQQIEVIRDLPPEIEFVAPRQDEVDLPANGTLEMEIVANDPDFALRMAKFSASARNQPLIDKLLLDEVWRGQWVKKYRFEPAKLGLKAGDVVEYHALAEDNKDPRPNRVETTKRRIRIVSPSTEQQKQDQVAQNGQQGQKQQGDKGEKDGEARPDTGDRSQGEKGESKDNGADQSPEHGDDNERSEQDKADQNRDDKPSAAEKPVQDNAAQRNPPDGTQESPNDQNKDHDQGDPQAADKSDATGEKGAKGDRSSAAHDEKQSVPSDGTDDGDAFERILKHRDEQNAPQPDGKPSDKGQQDAAGQDQSNDERSADQDQQRRDQSGQDQQGRSQKNQGKQGQGQQGRDQQGQGENGEKQQPEAGRDSSSSGKSDAKDDSSQNAGDKSKQSGDKQQQSGKHDSQKSDSNERGDGSQKSEANKSDAKKSQGDKSQGDKSNDKQSGDGTKGNQSAKDRADDAQHADKRKSDDEKSDGGSRQGQKADGKGRDAKSDKRPQQPSDKQPETADQPPDKKNNQKGSGANDQGQGNDGGGGGEQSEKDQAGKEGQSARSSRQGQGKGKNPGQSGKNPDGQKSTGGEGEQNASQAGDQSDKQSQQKSNGDSAKPSDPSKSGDGSKAQRTDDAGKDGQSTQRGQQDKQNDTNARDGDANHRDASNTDNANAKPAGDNSKQGEGGKSKGEQGRRPEQQPSQDKNSGAKGENAEQEKGDAGAGQSSKDQQGSPSTDQPTKPTSKSPRSSPDDKDQKPDDEAQGAADNQRESDSEGADSGMLSGGGKKGGGQKANKSGTGSSGQNTPSDEGAGRSNESGKGEDSDRAGNDRQADKQTGKSGDKPGEGSKTQSANQGQPGAGQQQGSPSGESSTGNQAGNQSQNQSQNQPNASQNGPPGSGTPGAGRRTPGDVDITKRPSSPEVADAANLEYTRKSTDLALEHLKNELAKDEPDPELLNQLGWSRRDLERFVQRWEKMRAEAQTPGATGEAAKRELDETLRSLGLRPRATSLKSKAGPGDQVQGVKESRRTTPPPEYREQSKAYSQGTARGGR